MKVGVVVFPGSNCDRDLAVAFRAAGADVTMVWHKDTSLPSGLDMIGIPGGFSFGDYLRCGAIAAQSPICHAVVDHAKAGGYVFGVCNGFQILTETGLLPGALQRNANLKFTCKTIPLVVKNTDSAYTSGYTQGQQIMVPIANHDGNYTADADTVLRLQGQGRVAFTYGDNPNGSVGDIAGILSENHRVLGMMPHPERAADSAHGGTDGQVLFKSVVGAVIGSMQTA